MNKVYVAIDLKSFYASNECSERGLDPLKTNLVLDGLNLGIKADGGLYMLIAQAVYAIKLFKNT